MEECFETHGKLLLVTVHIVALEMMRPIQHDGRPLLVHGLRDHIIWNKIAALDPIELHRGRSLIYEVGNLP